MLAGEIYSAVDPQLIEELTEVKEIIHDYNLLRPSEKEEAREILKGLLGHIADDNILINQPFYCDYGKQMARMSASTRLAIVQTPWSATAVGSGQNQSSSAIMYG